MSSFTRITVMFGDGGWGTSIEELKRVAREHLAKMEPQRPPSTNRSEQLPQWFLQHLVDLTDYQVHGYTQHGIGAIQWAVQSRDTTDVRQFVKPLTAFFIDYLELNPPTGTENISNILVMAQWENADSIEVGQFNARSIVKVEGKGRWINIRKALIPFSYGGQ